MQLLFDNGDEHVGGDGAPDLRLHGVLAVAQESLDAQCCLINNSNLTEVPRMLSFIRGVINLRGAVVDAVLEIPVA